MKLKTLLLSSAAAFVVVGGAAAAQAADLSVAEPVDYVKVCDAFGAGYWYIPGTDTCLKIGGLVRMDIQFHSNAIEDWSGSLSSAGTASFANHSASWNMQTEYHLDVTAKSMTEYGPLTAFAELRAQSNNADASNNVVSATNSGGLTNNGTKFAYLDTAYLSLGMLTVGRLESAYAYSGGFNWDWMNYDADNNVDQVKLTWAMSGFGIALAVEDPRDRWGTNLSTSYSTPDVIGALTWSQGKWSGQLSGGFGETAAGSGFGAQFGTTVKLDAIAPGDQLLLKAAWAQSEVPAFAATTGPTVASGGSVWSAAASFQHFWSPTLSSAVTFQYFDESGTSSSSSNYNAYSVVGNLVWAPVTGFYAGVEGGYSKFNTNSDGTWGVKIRLERDW